MAETRVTIEDVANSLTSVGERLKTQWQNHGWQTSQNAHVSMNWMAPSISIDEVIAELEFAADRVMTLLDRKMTKHEAEYTFRLKKRADQLSVANVSSDFDAIFGNILELANSVFRHIPAPLPPPPPPPKVDWENLKDQRDLLPKDLARRLRFVEARLTELEPRSENIEQQIADIEAAHQTAEQLPTDLADLASRKLDLEKLLIEATRLSDEIMSAHTRAEDGKSRIDSIELDGKARIDEAKALADSMLQRSEQALRGATSAGLAKAFDNRSKQLSTAGNWWVVGLALALACALGIGAERVHSLKDVLTGEKSAAVVIINFLLTVFGIGAPVWFAWLSTKQIASSFRLAEDYAFKASVSQAYEGYRAEAVQVDDALRKRLFESALTRLEESPIRLLETTSHSSPLSELLSNPAVRKSLEGIPGIADKIVALIPGKAGAAAAVVAPVAAATAVASVLATSHEDENQN